MQKHVTSQPISRRMKEYCLRGHKRDDLNSIGACNPCLKITRLKYRMTHKKEISIRNKEFNKNNPHYKKNWKNRKKSIEIIGYGKSEDGADSIEVRC